MCDFEKVNCDKCRYLVLAGFMYSFYDINVISECVLNMISDSMKTWQEHYALK